MSTVLSLQDSIHMRALAVVSRYKTAEAELVDILQQVEEHRVFVKRGHSSLFAYAVTELGLSENVVYSLIAVARKSRAVPELKEQMKAGALSLTNAKRIVSVLKVENTPEQNQEWIQKAVELSSRKLEKEIVKENPKEATQEKAAYVARDRVELQVGLSEQEMLRLRKVQDLLCQAKKRTVSLEETIAVLTGEFLSRHDPVEKAKRHIVRKGVRVESENLTIPVETLVARQVRVEDRMSAAPSSFATRRSRSVARPVERTRENSREYIPASLRHQVNLRDNRKCAHKNPDGSHCGQSRWLEIHHIQPVSEGGKNTLENLITLCSNHHQFAHL